MVPDAHVGEGGVKNGRKYANVVYGRSLSTFLPGALYIPSTKKRLLLKYPEKLAEKWVFFFLKRFFLYNFFFIKSTVFRLISLPFFYCMNTLWKLLAFVLVRKSLPPFPHSIVNLIMEIFSKL